MSSTDRPIGTWLFVVAGFVLAMVVVGGLTRLSHSGLSIVEWKPITGVIPPIGDEAWAAEYAKYQASPEGRTVNAGMSLDAFRGIFWVEWAHRLLGRVTGLVVFLPLVFFAATRRLHHRLWPLLGIFALGGLQGLVGWLMVKSGLVDAPRVSHYRLTLHLGLALLTLSLLLWVALGAMVPRRIRVGAPSSSLGSLAIGSLVLTSVTVLWGGLMAGTHAGLAAPTFPTMNGTWIPADLTPAELGPLWSWTENALSIHFLHRMLAYATTLAVLLTVGITMTSSSSRFTRACAMGMSAHVLVQVALGVLTVLGHVPMLWASLHQLNGALLLGWCVAFLYGVRRT